MQKPLFSSTQPFLRPAIILHLLVLFLRTICSLFGPSRRGKMRSLGWNKYVSEEKKPVSGFRPAPGQRRGRSGTDAPEAAYPDDTLALPLGRASPCLGYCIQVFLSPVYSPFSPDWPKRIKNVFP